MSIRPDPDLLDEDVWESLTFLDVEIAVSLYRKFSPDEWAVLSEWILFSDEPGEL